MLTCAEIASPATGDLQVDPNTERADFAAQGMVIRAYPMPLRDTFQQQGLGSLCSASLLSPREPELPFVSTQAIDSRGLELHGESESAVHAIPEQNGKLPCYIFTSLGIFEALVGSIHGRGRR